MSLGRSERIRWALALIAALAMAVVPRLLEPRPYSDVEVVSLDRAGRTVEMVVDWRKNNCERLSVSFLAWRLGAFVDVTGTWEALDGVVEGSSNFDRLAGQQRLHGRVTLPDDGSFDRLEIRTRHDCDGRRVDGVFLDEAL